MTTNERLREAMNALAYSSGPCVLWDKNRNVMGAIVPCRNAEEGQAICRLLSAYMGFTVDLLNAKAGAK